VVPPPARPTPTFVSGDIYAFFSLDSSSFCLHLNDSFNVTQIESCVTWARVEIPDSNKGTLYVSSQAAGHDDPLRNACVSDHMLGGVAVQSVSLWRGASYL
jgi:hypothetical protein